MSLRDALRTQSQSNAALGSPFTARLLALVADRIEPGTKVADRMFAWEGDITPWGASLPLRFLGGLHALVLTGRSAQLAAVFPPSPEPDDAALWAAIEAALTAHEDVLMRWLDSPPQTNEVRRAAAIICAASWIADRTGLPFTLSELGASAGLNLMWDRFALQTPHGLIGACDPAITLAPEWRGDTPPKAPTRVVERRGVDLNPLLPSDPDDATRLISYLWADQLDRLARTRAVIDIFDAPVDPGDAAAWLEARLAAPRPGQVHLVYHTVAWQYFPDETKARCLAALEAAGARATPDAPIARFGMEADDQRGAGAAMSLTLWPGGEVLDMGRIDFHGRWIDWKAPA